MSSRRLSFTLAAAALLGAAIGCDNRPEAHQAASEIAPKTALERTPKQDEVLGSSAAKSAPEDKGIRYSLPLKIVKFDKRNNEITIDPKDLRAFRLEAHVTGSINVIDATATPKSAYVDETYSALSSNFHQFNFTGDQQVITIKGSPLQEKINVSSAGATLNLDLKGGDDDIWIGRYPYLAGEFEKPVEHVSGTISIQGEGRVVINSVNHGKSQQWFLDNPKSQKHQAGPLSLVGIPDKEKSKFVLVLGPYFDLENTHVQYDKATNTLTLRHQNEDNPNKGIVVKGFTHIYKLGDTHFGGQMSLEAFVKSLQK